MILGMNVLEFMILASLGVIVVAWCCDFGMGIYEDLQSIWTKKQPKPDEELTVSMAVGSFDPDVTMSLPKIKKQRVESVFIIRQPEWSTNGPRHARR